MRTAILKPDGPFTKRPRSDTLFGAVCWGIRLTRGEDALEELLLQFADDDPPFRLSSAYPVLAPASRSERVHLLPRPLVPMQSVADDEATERIIEALQRWQRLQYIPEDLFRKLAEGGVTKSDVVIPFADGDDTVTIDGTAYAIKDEFLLPDSYELDRPPFVTGERTRNAVNRLSNSTEGQLFHDRSFHVVDGAALHVVIEGDIETALTGLAAIQDHGIGGDKSVGKGTYTLGELGEPGLTPAQTGPSCTLSLCIPRDAVLDTVATSGYYDVETRKGVLESSLVSGTDIWKKQVLALAEGAILPEFDGHIGYNPVVADRFEHGVQQYGYELPVAIDGALLRSS